MRRIKLKKRHKISPLTYIIVLIFILVVSLIWCFKYIGISLTDKVESYAEAEVRKIITLVVTKSVSNEVIDSFNTNDIFIENNNTVDFNSVNINKIVAIVNRNLKQNLSDLESGKIELEQNTFLPDKSKLKKGIIYEVPSGIIFNNPILSNIGPKIPVKLHLIGDIVTGVETHVTDYGINNAIIELDLVMTIHEQMVLPFSKKEIEIKESIPIAIKMIQGKVPNYYSSGKGIPILTNN